MVWEGEQANIHASIIKGKSATCDHITEMGGIRFTYSITRTKNVVHASDTADEAEKHIKIWFTDDEIIKY